MSSRTANWPAVALTESRDNAPRKGYKSSPGRASFSSGLSIEFEVNPLVTATKHNLNSQNTESQD